MSNDLVETKETLRIGVKFGGRNWNYVVESLCFSLTTLGDNVSSDIYRTITLLLTIQCHSAASTLSEDDVFSPRSVSNHFCAPPTSQNIHR